MAAESSLVAPASLSDLLTQACTNPSKEQRVSLLQDAIQQVSSSQSVQAALAVNLKLLLRLSRRRDGELLKLVGRLLIIWSSDEILQEVVEREDLKLLVEFGNEFFALREKTLGSDLADELYLSGRKVLLFLIQRCGLSIEQQEAIRDILKRSAQELGSETEAKLDVVLQEVSSKASDVHLAKQLEAMQELMDAFGSLTSIEQQFRFFKRVKDFLREQATSIHMPMRREVARFLEYLTAPGLVRLEQQQQQQQAQQPEQPQPDPAVEGVDTHSDGGIVTGVQLFQLQKERAFLAQVMDCDIMSVIKALSPTEEAHVQLTVVQALLTLWRGLPAHRAKLLADTLDILGLISHVEDSEAKQFAAHLLRLMAQEPMVAPAIERDAAIYPLKQIPLPADMEFPKAVSLEHVAIKVGAPFCQTIEAGSILEKHIEVQQTPALLHWAFATLQNDIQFEVRRTPLQYTTDAPSMASDADQYVVVVASQRYDCNSKPVQGSVVVSEPGIYSFIWDNRYSWFSAKRLRYRVYALDSVSKEGALQAPATSPSSASNQQSSIQPPVQLPKLTFGSSSSLLAPSPAAVALNGSDPKSPAFKTPLSSTVVPSPPVPKAVLTGKQPVEPARLPPPPTVTLIEKPSAPSIPLSVHVGVEINKTYLRLLVRCFHPDPTYKGPGPQRVEYPLSGRSLSLDVFNNLFKTFIHESIPTVEEHLGKQVEVLLGVTFPRGEESHTGIGSRSNSEYLDRFKAAVGWDITRAPFVQQTNAKVLLVDDVEAALRLALHEGDGVIKHSTVVVVVVDEGVRSASMIQHQQVIPCNLATCPILVPLTGGADASGPVVNSLNHFWKFPDMMGVGVAMLLALMGPVCVILTGSALTQPNYFAAMKKSALQHLSPTLRDCSVILESSYGGDMVLEAASRLSLLLDHK